MPAIGISVAAGRPRIWAKRDGPGILSSEKWYDPAPDGKRVVVTTQAPEESTKSQQDTTHLIFLLNFFYALRRLTSAGGK